MEHYQKYKIASVTSDLLRHIWTYSSCSGLDFFEFYIESKQEITKTYL